MKSLFLETKDGGDTVTTTFRDVKFAKPDAALFVLPSDLTRYANTHEMMGAMQRMMGGQ